MDSESESNQASLTKENHSEAPQLPLKEENTLMRNLVNPKDEKKRRNRRNILPFIKQDDQESYDLGFEPEEAEEEIIEKPL